MSGFPDSEVSAWGGAIAQHFERTHRCVYMCLPGYSTFDSSALEKAWGYETEEVLTMMTNTIKAVDLSHAKLTMVAHDWGAYFAILYTTRHPNILSKLILCDIGMCTALSLPMRFVPFVATYQIFFAVLYWVSHAVSMRLAELLFLALGIKYFYFLLSPPTLHRAEILRQSLTVRKCYPYYYLWRRLLTFNMLPQRFPDCPLLFIVSCRFIFPIISMDVRD
jgi:pimeloyl-ACP methyl ester carboxylesterase